MAENNDKTELLLRRLISLKCKNQNRLNKVKRQWAKKTASGIIPNAALLNLYKKFVQAKKIKSNSEFERLLQKRKIRTLSGVAPIAVLTKPYPCPGKCVYCPDEKGMPRSYLSNEPAVRRAILTKFNPHEQVTLRLNALEANGHNTDKIELIIMGGTWSYLPRRYQHWFVKQCFDAANGRSAPNLNIAHKWNEKAKHRIVALTVETRPDYVNESEIKYWRKLGATKVELGVQSLDDSILKINKRGHDAKAVIKATKLLKQAGFKIAFHIMPNLLGATPKSDWQTYKQLFSDERFQPDMLKIYPTVINANSNLYKRYRAGKYKPYPLKILFNLLLKMKLATPPYVRIIRLVRDIPKESIVAGNKISNLREVLQAELKKVKKNCRCIRCREARENIEGIATAKLSQIKYRASGAEEFFLQFTGKSKKKLFAFLRLPDKTEKNFIPEIQGAAMIREVHTYGRLVGVGKRENAVQHAGLGTRLTQKAEEISRKQGFKKIVVIAGVGVRRFYRKLGYKPEGTYMTKYLH